ncbi:TPA: protein disulfide oxidoreductase [Vibrio vulnificus]|nr:protein disulfide oxidoreductase [Vibrio vulnificus]HAS8524849.1 protein disulfide oxidoreductase [Vibrio vulnificus]
MKIVKILKEWLPVLAVVLIVSIALDFYYSRNLPKDNALPLSAMTTLGTQADLLSASQGSPVVVYFWATWCGPCKLVSPTINQIADSYPVISVAMQSGDEGSVNQYLQSQQYDYDTINDPTGKISRDWGVQVTPTVVIVRNGKIEFITSGVSSPIGLWLRLWLS